MQSVAQVSQNQTTASSTQKRCRTQLIASINSQLKALQGGAAQVALLPALASAIPDATLLVLVVPDLVQELAVPHALVPVPAPVAIPVPGLALVPVLAPVLAPVAQAVPEDARALVAQIVPLHVPLGAPVDAQAAAIATVLLTALVVAVKVAVEIAEMDVRAAGQAANKVVAETLVWALVHLSALIAVHSGKKVVYQNE